MGPEVMGHMLALNMVRNGICVAGDDIDTEKVKNFAVTYQDKNLLACSTLREFFATLEHPRHRHPGGRWVLGI
jgi:6-phosphogluconate dehydrogenase